MSAIQGLTLLGLNDARLRLGISRNTITRLVTDGSLPALRLDDRWYVEARDLEAFARTYQPRRNVPSQRRITRNDQSRIAVLATLADWQEATATEIAEAISLHPGNVRKHLALLEKAGATQRVGDALWSLTEAGMAMAPAQAQAS